MKPKVSIIVPIYNVEEYLDRCINSLVNQTLREIEIILVDDGSPDRCPQMCDEWAKKDYRIKVIHKKNEGLGLARNSGLNVAIGDFVAFLDSDDYLELETYEKVYEEAIANNLDICYFYRRKVDQNNRRIEIYRNRLREEYFNKSEVMQYMLNVVGHKPSDKIQRVESFSVCMAIYRKSIIDNSQCRFVSEKFVASEDLLFHLDLLPHVGRIVVLPNVFYNNTINSASISHNYNEAKRNRMKLLLQVVREKLERSFSYEEYYPHYCSQIMRIYRVILKFEATSPFSYRHRMTRINEICKDDILKEFYVCPYIKDYPISMRIFIILMKCRFTLLLIAYYIFRSNFKKV